MLSRKQHTKWAAGRRRTGHQPDRWRPGTMLLAASVLSAGMASAAGTPSSSITLVDRFSPQGTTIGGALRYEIEISNSAGSALTGVQVPALLSGIASSISSASSSCGGSLVGAGTATPTWTGMTIAAAPSVSSPTICVVSFTGLAVTTSGTYTTAVPASHLTTDQGLTNPSGSAASLNVLPLQPMSAALSAVSPSGGGVGSPIQVRLQVNNPNSTDVAGIASKINWNSNPRLINQLTFTGGSFNRSQSTCPPAVLDSVQSGSVVGSDGVTITGMMLSAQTNCTLVWNTAYVNMIEQNSSGSERGTNPGYVERNFFHQLNASTNSTSSNANWPAITSGLSYLPQAITLGASINGANSYNIGESMSPPVLDTGVRNSGAATTSVSYTLRVTTTGTTRLDSSLGLHPSSAGCATPTVAVDGAGLVATVTQSVSPGQTCTVRFGLRNLDAAGSNVTTSFLIRGQDVSYTDERGMAPEGTVANAANAYVTSSPTWSVGKFGTSSFPGSWGWYSLNVYNSGGTTLNNINFTDQWTHALTLSAAEPPRSTCGANMTTLASNKGVSVSGLNLAPNSGCIFILPIDPAAPVGTYPNSTELFSDASSLGTVSATAYYSTPAPADASSESLTVNLGEPFLARFSTTNFMASDRANRVEVNLPAGLSVTGTPRISCVKQNLGLQLMSGAPSGLAGTELSSSQYVLSGGYLSLRATIPAQSFNDAYNTLRSQCFYIVPMTLTTAGSYTVPVGLRSPSDTDILQASPGMTLSPLRVTSAAQQNYQMNISFSPQTVVAGGSTSMQYQVSLSSGGSGNSAYSVINNQLPTGMEVATSAFTPNQPDGRYVSPDRVQGTQVAGVSALPCLEISADRTRITARCVQRSGYQNIPITLTRYGDLINTVTPADFSVPSGTLTSSASASAKATRGVPVTHRFSVGSARADGSVTLSTTLNNATVAGDPPSTITVDSSVYNLIFDSDASGNVPASGSCGAQVTVSGSSLTYSGVTLGAQQSCDVVLTARTAARAALTFTGQIITAAGGARADSGASNPAMAMASVQWTPLNQCVSALGSAGTLPAGRSSGLNLSWTNTGEGAITSASLSATSSGGPAWSLSLGGAPGSTNPQTAWTNWLAANPQGLQPGQTLSGTVTFVVSSGEAEGSVQSVSVSLNPTSGVSCGAQTAVVTGTVSRPVDGSVSLWQANCLTADCLGPQWTQSPLSPAPCQYVAYEVRGVLSSQSDPLRRAALKLDWPAHLSLVRLEATQPGGVTAPVQWMVGGIASTQAPTTLQPGQVLTVWNDISDNGSLDDLDVLQPGQSFTLRAIGQVACAP